MSKIVKKSKVRIALGAIFKNEGPYILEWIAAHQAVGFEQFYIADNNSTDGSTELLQELDRQKVIRLIPFPGKPDQPPQLDAYAKIMQKYSQEFDWIGFIDADEYLAPTTDFLNIADQIRTLTTKNGVGGIVVNWATFGSASQTHYNSAPTIERFTQRADQPFGVNKHYKSFIKTEAYLSPYSNPHLFFLKDDYTYIHTNGDLVVNDQKTGPGLSEKIIWQSFRLNHYIIRSRQEFEAKKSPKGSATTVGRIKGEKYFTGHDKNEVSDPPNQQYIETARQRLDQLIRKIPKNILKGVEFDMPELMRFEKRKVFGRIDDVRLDGNIIIITGWSTLMGHNSRPKLYISSDIQEIVMRQTRTINRPDLVKKFDFPNAAAGFESTLEISEIDKTAILDGNFKFWGEISDTIEELKIEPGQWPSEDIKIKAGYFLRIAQQPTMPEECITYFNEAIAKARVYIEYGTGGSTVSALRQFKCNTISVESDFYWLKSVENEVKLIPNNNERFTPIYINIGKTKEWGYPVDDSQWKNFWRYPLAAWEHCLKRELTPDLVLIDGRFRTACFAASLLNIKSPCTIMFDDYTDRPHYHSVEKFIKPCKFIGRMAVFEISTGFKINEEVISFLAEAITDTR